MDDKGICFSQKTGAIGRMVLVRVCVPEERVRGAKGHVGSQGVVVVIRSAGCEHIHCTWRL